MRRCFELAELARAVGDTPVGSLVTHGGELVAEGIEAVKARLDVSAHAEINAIRDACQARHSLDLRGCVLYTTAEPCWMCSYAIRQTGITEVIIGSDVPWVGGVSSQHPILTDAAVGCWAAPPVVTYSALPGLTPGTK